MERIANEKISESASFKALSDLCEKQIPVYSNFVYSSKSASWKGSDYITYFYTSFYTSKQNSNADWQAVKEFYRGYFSKEGWVLTNENDTSWGPSTLEHRNDKFVVRIYYKGLGDADYGFHCANLPELDEYGNPRH